MNAVLIIINMGFEMPSVDSIVKCTQLGRPEEANKFHLADVTESQNFPISRARSPSADLTDSTTTGTQSGRKRNAVQAELVEPLEDDTPAVLNSKSDSFQKVSERLPSRSPFTDVFMKLAMSLAMRTADLNTGVGCVLVNQYCQILGIGYNGESKDTPAFAAVDNADEHMVHTEMNAICHSSANLMREDIYVFVTRTSV
jgi:deoxycytidylate deaminase